MRIAVVETAVDFARAVVAERVELHVVGDVDPRVRKELVRILDLGLPPDLRRIQDGCVACRSDRGCVVALNAAIRRIRLVVFEAQVREAVRTERQADIRRGQHRRAVALIERAVARSDRSAFGGILQLEIDDAGNRVGTVLSRRTVAQYLYRLQRDAWNRADVRTLCTVGDAVAEEVDDARTMTPLAVHEYQRVVGR